MGHRMSTLFRKMSKAGNCGRRLSSGTGRATCESVVACESVKERATRNVIIILCLRLQDLVSVLVNS